MMVKHSDEKARVIVSLDVDGTDREAWDQAVSTLKRHGLEVAKELDVVGMVSGAIEPEKIPSLRKQNHVVDVSDDEVRRTAT